MAKVWDYDEACIICGRLYGDLLARDADEAGFKYAVDRLSSGIASVRDLVEEICVSDEFREKFLMNQTPNEFARRLLLKLSREPRADPKRVKAMAVALLEDDWRKIVTGVIRGPRYTAAFGDDDVPLWA
jgi:hypothetical protein